jgi:hypothetical protein
VTRTASAPEQDAPRKTARIVASDMIDLIGVSLE